MTTSSENSHNGDMVDLDAGKEPISIDHVEGIAGSQAAPVFPKHVQTWALRKVLPSASPAKYKLTDRSTSW
jgi:hypothetical protein